MHSSVEKSSVSENGYFGLLLCGLPIYMDHIMTQLFTHEFVYLYAMHECIVCARV